MRITDIAYAQRKRAREAKAQLASSSIFTKFFKAMDYEKIAEYTFEIIEASLHGKQRV